MRKSYIGVKSVEAEEITLEQFIKDNGRNPYEGKEEVSDDLKVGYAVTYPDGYVGYCPKAEFEKAYRPTNRLNRSMIGMNSANRTDRFKAEYSSLKERYERLKNMLKKWDEGTLDFTPKCPRSMYDKQLEHMEKYMKTLERRANMEKVDIKEES